MKVLGFYLNCLLLYYFLPIIISTYIENDQVKASQANPLVIEKLLEKLDKYQKNLGINRDGTMKTDNIFETKPKSEETGNNIFGNSVKDFKINIFPTSEEKHINAFGKEIKSASLLKEKKEENIEIERIKEEIRKEQIKKEQELKNKPLLQDNSSEYTSKTANFSALPSKHNEKPSHLKKEIKNEFVFKEVESELESSHTPITYIFRYNPLYSLLYISVIIVILYIFILLRDFVQNHLNDQLTNTLNTILKDAIIIILLCTIIQVFNYYSFFGSLPDYVDIDGICIDLAVFSLLWLVLGIYNVFISQSFVNRWNSFEKRLPDRENIKRSYERLDNQKKNNEPLSRVKLKEYYEKREILEYFILREEFLFPSFLPPVSESFLREDFFFAGYLSRAMARTSKKSFKLSISSLFTILIISLAWLLFEFISEEVSFWMMLLFPVLVTIILIILYKKLEKIYTLLVNVFSQTFEANFPGFQNVRHPWINIDAIKPPGFLEIEYSKSHEPPSFKEIVRPNKHEKIFWFASPNLHIRLLHFMLIIQVVWLVAFLTYFYRDSSTVYICSIVALVIFGISINLFYLMPLNIYYLCITCNIQMLKNLKLINEVVMEQRQLTTLLVAKLYRFLKSNYKIMDGPEYRAQINLRDITKRQLGEIFSSLDKNNQGYLDLMSLLHIVHLCGRDLEEDELVCFGRECIRDNQTVVEESLVEGVNKFAIDVTLDPAETSINTLRQMIRKTGNQDDMISVKLFKKIMKEHKMDKDDIKALRHEISYLTLENVMSHSLHTVGHFIRNMIEGMPK